jgi:hypothetical protein
VIITNTIASKHTRSATGRRPCRSGTLTGGIIGSTTSQISSRTSNTVATANSIVVVMSPRREFARGYANPLSRS